MNKATKFSHLGSRWGGRVSLLPHVVISRNLLMSIVLLALMLFILFPAVAQDVTPSPDVIVTVTPEIITAESMIAPTVAPDVVTEAPVVAPTSSTVDTAIVFALLALVAVLGLGGTALVGYAMRRLGDSVPADKVQEIVDSAQKWTWQQLQMAVARTPQQWDDTLVNVGAGVFGYNPAVGTPTRQPLPPRTLPPEPPVNPSVPMPVPPQTPQTIVRNFGATEQSFENTYNGNRRVIHVPANTSPAFDERLASDAGGIRYPMPSVNVNSAYGVKFDIAFIAGLWGFTILETLVAGVRYKVELHYSAEVHAKEENQPIRNWLWHELAMNGVKAGANQGIENGTPHVAEWEITGTGDPMMLTVFIRALWASGQDNSAVMWHKLVISPVA